MPRLNNDCLRILFENFIDEPNGCGLLYSCALLNREWRNIATPYLYRDPWKYWLYQCKDDDIAKQLINTYMSCYDAIQAERSDQEEEEEEGEEEEERPPKRVAIHIENDQNYGKVPLYDYIALAKNLHIPSLYQCVKIWYDDKNSYENDNEESIQPAYELFLKIFELFVDRAYIRDCTFAESTEDDKYPIKLDQLDQLINRSRKVNLKYLNMGFYQCDSNGLSRITGRCDSLKTFKISAQHCSDESLADFLRSQRCLTKLKIRNAEKIDLTLNALESLSDSLVKLRILSSNLESCNSPLSGIAACRKLRSIYMRNITWPVYVSPLTLLMPIAKNCEFHNVDFSNTYLPADILVEIAKKSSTTLRRVHLVRPENQIDHEKYNLSTGIKALADHAKNLVHFERDILPREIEAIKYLLNSLGNSLTRLEIESKLMNSPDVDSSLVEDIVNLCPNLEVLNISYFNFTSQVFEKLIRNCRSLSSLIICNSISVNDTILNIIREHRSENLKNLEILACSHVSEDAVEELRRAETDLDIGWP